jgi:hypothetical protein
MSQEQMNAETAEYSFQLGKMLMDPIFSPTGGRYSVPGDYVTSLLYNQVGISSKVIEDATTSAIVLFDAEASVRNGQTCARLLERDASNQVIKETVITAGTPSTDFITVGVMSSSMMCSNTSGEDFISGTQSAAVLYSAPSQLRYLTSSDLQNIVQDKDRDLLNNMSSKGESTYTACPTNHFGLKTGLTRGSITSNRLLITKQVIGKNRSLNPGLSNTIEPWGNFYDSDLIESDNPFTFATYSARASYEVTMTVEDDSIGDQSDRTFIMLAYVRAYSADGTLLYSMPIESSASEMKYDTQSSNGTSHTGRAHFKGTLELRGQGANKSRPVARVTISVGENPIRRSNDSSGNIRPGIIGNLSFMEIDDALVVIDGVEEVDDVPLRPLHVCIFEGLNSNATLTVHCGAAVTGVAASENVAVSSQGRDTAGVDMIRVKDYLSTLSTSMPHVFTYSGKELTMKLYGGMPDEGLPRVLEAKSFDVLKRGFNKFKKVAKQVKKTSDRLGITPMVTNVIDDAVETGIGFLPGGPVVQTGARMAYDQFKRDPVNTSIALMPGGPATKIGARLAYDQFAN